MIADIFGPRGARAVASHFSRMAPFHFEARRLSGSAG